MKYGCPIYNCSVIEELESGVKYLEKRVNECLEFGKKLSNEGIHVESWLHLEREDKPKPFFVIFDEIHQYLAKRQLKPPTKDSSEEEKQEYKIFLLQKKLAYLINHIASVHRYMGNFILLASQDSRMGSYMVDIGTNFKSMIISQQNDAQSKNLTGSRIATDKSLRKGRFLFIYDTIEKIQAPLATKVDTTGFKRRFPDES